MARDLTDPITSAYRLSPSKITLSDLNIKIFVVWGSAKTKMEVKNIVASNPGSSEYNGT
jgi:hypothetical protein